MHCFKVLTYALNLLSIVLYASAQDPNPSSGPVVQSTITVPGPTVTTYVAASTEPPSPQYTDSLTFRTSLLNSTNFFRFQHDALFLAWNDSLASYAQDYSGQCKWAHSYGPQGYGENLARGYPDIVSAVDAWGDERDLYVFAPPDKVTGFSEQTGHFTQLVWKDTQTVGCGFTACNGKNGIAGFLLVCEYWPPGNIESQGKNRNAYFEQQVQSQVDQGMQGYNTFSATAGATGVGTALATGSLIPTVPQSRGDSVRTRSKCWCTLSLAICFVIAAVVI